MREMVEIGMGRTARRTYELGDINIVPSRRTRSSQDVSTAWQLDAYRFEIPVLAHPTDALTVREFLLERREEALRDSAVVARAAAHVVLMEHATVKPARRRANEGRSYSKRACAWSHPSHD